MEESQNKGQIVCEPLVRTRTFTSEELDSHRICFGKRWVRYCDIDQPLLIYRDQNNLSLVTIYGKAFCARNCEYVNILFQTLVNVLTEELDTHSLVLDDREMAIVKHQKRLPGILFQHNPKLKQLSVVSYDEEKEEPEWTAAMCCQNEGMDTFLLELCNYINSLPIDKSPEIIGGDDINVLKIKQMLDNAYKTNEKRDREIGLIEIPVNLDENTVDMREVKRLKKMLRDANRSSDESSGGSESE